MAAARECDDCNNAQIPMDWAAPGREQWPRPWPGSRVGMDVVTLMHRQRQSNSEWQYWQSLMGIEALLLSKSHRDEVCACMCVVDVRRRC